MLPGGQRCLGHISPMISPCDGKPAGNFRLREVGLESLLYRLEQVRSRLGMGLIFRCVVIVMSLFVAFRGCDERSEAGEVSGACARGSGVRFRAFDGFDGGVTCCFFHQVLAGSHH